MRKRHSLRKLSLPSNFLIPQSYQTKSLWRIWSIYLYWESIKLGIWMQEESTLQSILRNGGIKTVIDHSINTENQEVSRIGNCLRRWSSPLKDHFLILRSKRLPTRVVDLRNSWIGLTSKNCQLWKQSSMTIIYVFCSIAYGTLSIHHSTQLSTNKLTLISWIKSEISKLSLRLHFQRKNSRLQLIVVIIC